MKLDQLLTHHGIAKNPFAEEDAQTDPIFKEHCITSAYHPTWDKVYGNPAEPATSIVFGEKGAGKTAIRLQIATRLAAYNRVHPRERIYVIEYDDFNPFLDRFRDRLSGRRQRADRALQQWRLWDHMDAILTLAVTGLVDNVLEVSQPSGWSGCKVAPDDVQKLDRHQARDLLVLAACYDQSTAETVGGRWHKLRRKLRFWTIKAQWDLALGIGVTAGVAMLMIALAVNGAWDWLKPIWMYLILLAAGWSPWLLRAWKSFWLARGIVKHLRVGNRETSSLRKIFMNFTAGELSGQPLPNKDRTDDRYELLQKFQGLVRTLGFTGIVVLVDRVDEPHLINGSTELMKALLWPMLDNKFLKQPGIGLKLLLPIELSRVIQREEREFYERARLDKQNMIPSLEWTGQALFDVANARIAACSEGSEAPKLRDLIDPSISDARLIEAFRSLRVPRHLFKFLYRLLVTHCNSHTEQDPVWQISHDTFESQLALYLRDQDAFDRGLGAG